MQKSSSQSPQYTPSSTMPAAVAADKHLRPENKKSRDSSPVEENKSETNINRNERGSIEPDILNPTSIPKEEKKEKPQKDKVKKKSVIMK